MKQLFYIVTLFLLSLNILAQNDISKYIGKYGDWMPNGEALITELELRADSTFKLRTIDNVYPQTFKDYTNEGKWILKDNEVILNPDLKRRKPIVTITEKQIGLKDSIQIKVNHYIELYENQDLVKKQKKEFELLTLYFNKRRKYKHLTRKWVKEGRCAWAPRIRNRVNLDTTNTFKIAKREVKKIGVYTYGFIDFIELKTVNENADYYEIDIVVPIDKERMPRNKKVIIKGKRAYFYEIRGKVKKSLNYLWRKNM